MLTVCLDENVGLNGGSICLAFSVENADVEYERLEANSVEIVDLLAVCPWGMKNILFFDPDGNRVYFRSLMKANGGKNGEDYEREESDCARSARSEG